jgi:hypothetical protein
MSIPNQYGNGPLLSDFIAVQQGPPNYQAGWIKAATVAAAITPSAAGVADYQTYKQMVWQNYLVQSVNGFPNAFNVGFDDCLEMAGIWEWFYDPNSGHNKAS